jgi:hypothetical protein
MKIIVSKIGTSLGQKIRPAAQKEENINTELF